MIDIRQLRHFLAVLELGNFSAAADTVFVSQSALTRSIQALEQSLGATLLTRGARHSIPTAAGQRLAEYARMILQDCAEASAEVRVMTTGEVGEVAFGFDPVFAAPVIDTTLGRLGTEAAGLVLRAIAAPIPELLQGVGESRFEFAFIRLHETHRAASSLVFEPLLEYESVLFAGRGHPLARTRKLEPSDLVGAKWLVLEDPICSELHERFLERHHLPPARAVRTDSLTLIRDQILHGRFISLLPEPVLRRELRHRLVRRLDLELPETHARGEAGLITRRAETPSAAAARVIRLIRDACARTGIRPA